MRLSEYFLPMLKEEPREASIKSHSLMLRAGMIRQICSGIYTWLPIGLRVLRKLESILRQTMDSYGFIELLMPCMQPANLWQESRRYDAYGKEMLKSLDRHEQELIFGPTAEELITDLFRSSIHSHQELPKTFYQFQWKFRDEIRPRFGVLRAREFFLKDAYSFSIDEDSAIESYWQVYRAYLSFFKSLGLAVVPVSAVTGAIGGDLSHEFHIPAPAGESNLYFDGQIQALLQENEIDLDSITKLYAAADEKHQRDQAPAEVDLIETKGIEVGHTFYFGTKYSSAMKARVQDSARQMINPHMGSYGIGLSRLVGAIVEVCHDAKGIIWPKSVAPFQVGLVNLVGDGASAFAESIYKALLNASVEVLYDDSNRSCGQKLSCQDLLGLPWQIRVWSKLASEGMIEIVERSSEACHKVSLASLGEYISSFKSHKS